MLNCKQASQLASRTMDEKLPFWEYTKLKLHLLLCRSCTNFTQQLHFLHNASSHFKAKHGFQLTKEAKERIANALKEKISSLSD